MSPGERFFLDCFLQDAWYKRAWYKLVRLGRGSQDFCLQKARQFAPAIRAAGIERAAGRGLAQIGATAIQGALPTACARIPKAEEHQCAKRGVRACADS